MPKENVLSKGSISGRFAWVDCCKAMAIIAVLVDHTNGILYTSRYVGRASYYSVGLFVLLSGMTHAALKPEKLTFQSRLKKVGLLFGQYAAACFLIVMIYQKFFDFNTYITALLSFNLQGPFYFFVFFFQLLLIAPVLATWCRYCDAGKWRYLFHVLTVLFLFCFSSVSIRYTYILPVHGGGKYLFGGTYIVLFYIGIVLGQCGLLSKRQDHCICAFAGSLLAWVVCVLSIDAGAMIDRLFEPYLGDGFNPPGIQYIIFTIISFMMFRSLFLFLEYHKDLKICSGAVKLFSLIGRNSLYVFMYHLTVRDWMTNLITPDTTSVWVYRILIFMPMLLIPVLVPSGLGLIKSNIRAVCGDVTSGTIRSRSNDG